MSDIDWLKTSRDLLIGLAGKCMWCLFADWSRIGVVSVISAWSLHALWRENAGELKIMKSTLFWQLHAYNQLINLLQFAFHLMWTTFLFPRLPCYACKLSFHMGMSCNHAYPLRSELMWSKGFPAEHYLSGHTRTPRPDCPRSMVEKVFMYETTTWGPY